MRLAGYAKFETTHESYLAVKNDLIERARAATTHTVSQELLENCWSRDFEGGNGKG